MRRLMIVPVVALAVGLAGCAEPPATSRSDATAADRVRAVISDDNPILSVTDAHLDDLASSACRVLDRPDGGEFLRGLADTNETTSPDPGRDSIPDLNRVQTLETMKALVTFYCTEKLRLLPW